MSAEDRELGGVRRSGAFRVTVEIRTAVRKTEVDVKCVGVVGVALESDFAGDGHKAGRNNEIGRHPSQVGEGWSGDQDRIGAGRRIAGEDIPASLGSVRVVKDELGAADRFGALRTPLFLVFGPGDHLDELNVGVAVSARQDLIEAGKVIVRPDRRVST